ncbi:MAG TPA: hypothetical protein VM489_00955, partial [Burkholderiales bacterium]|nr:hypothetical protein [Burkholderiales bacterium]
CGNAGVREGLAPVALSSAASCDSRWSATASVLGGLLWTGCTQQATYVSCTFVRLLGSLLPATITATANIGNGFRGTITASDISVSGTTDSFTMALATNGVATATIQVTFNPLPLLSTTEVRIPYVPDARFLTDTSNASYLALRWFQDNHWRRYTYFAVAPGATPGASPTCGAGGTCLTVSGLPGTSDTRLVLVLSGRALATQTQPSGTLANYLEAGNATTGDLSFQSGAITSSFNDRVAACPLQYTSASGTESICN